jgi:hypothetical protein
MHPPDLGHSIRQVDDFVSTLARKGTPGFDRDLGEEAKKRMRQLATCITRIVILAQKLEAAHEAISQRGHPLNPEIPQLMRATIELSDEMERETENFYQTAWRLRNIIRSFPGLASFEVTSVRDVRNKLIMHPEKHGNRFLNSFEYNSEVGPRLKPQSSGTPAFIDVGLWLNAQQLAECISERLTSEEGGPPT